MTEYEEKIKKNIMINISDINGIKILELGVKEGVSTKNFLEICKKNNGSLYSVDIEDCSNVSNDPHWKFIQSRDDNFEFIKKKIADKLDVIYIDSLHEADHVEKLIYNYYEILNKNGYIFIDDINHLPYIKKEKRNNFYCEINNKETHDRIFDIYSNNTDNFDLNFSYMSSGTATIFKKADKNLNKRKKIITRTKSIKNIVRLLYKKISK
tara:strand:+ start:294 stop:923 length:630 start_codon:yes stop_codon:yes gene_type:complete